MNDPEGAQCAEIVVTLPALYGPGSPLPAFVTERLMPGERALARAFIDLLNHRLLSLAILVAARRDLESTSARQSRLAGWCGVPASLMRYAGLLRGPRGLADLQALLTDLCCPTPVAVIANLAGCARLPVELRARLGHGCVRLGVDAVIGERIDARATAFRVRVGPLPACETFPYLPEGELHREIVAVVDRFNRESLEFDFEILVDGASLPVAALGGGFALGCSTRLAGETPTSYARRLSVSPPQNRYPAVAPTSQPPLRKVSRDESPVS